MQQVAALSVRGRATTDGEWQPQNCAARTMPCDLPSPGNNVNVDAPAL